MYTACVFCTAHLGRNDVVEHFPVGTRLAFDAAKGLLWVVCRKCERWNLTPLEERWEAIEECERLFRDTRLRASSEHIGLARMRDGTDLVRIGRPLRPELAAWRYGDQFGKRRRRRILGGTAAATAYIGASIGLPMLGVPAALIGGIAMASGWGAFLASMAAGGAPLLVRPRWFRDAEGQWLWVGAQELALARLVQAPGGGWGLRLPFRARRALPAGELRDVLNLPPVDAADLRGDAAMAAMRTILPLVNGQGGDRRLVRDAVQQLDALGTGEDAFRTAAERMREISSRQTWGDTGALVGLPRDVRLALEMAAHEDVERRAMEGELAELERAWKDAAELAGIAESLLPRPEVDARVDAMKRRSREHG